VAAAGPGETRAVELAYASLAGVPVHGDAFAHAFEEGDGLREPNRVGVSSHLAGSGKQFCAAAREWSGVSLAMRAGWRCWFEDLRCEGELLTGRLVGGEVARPVGVDEGTPALVAWPAGDETAAVTSPGEISPAGSSGSSSPARRCGGPAAASPSSAA
jgi:hypothetical protein